MKDEELVRELVSSGQTLLPLESLEHAHSKDVQFQVRRVKLATENELKRRGKSGLVVRREVAMIVYEPDGRLATHYWSGVAGVRYALERGIGGRCAYRLWVVRA